VYLGAGGVKVGKPSWRIQIYRALNAIDHIGHSKFAAKQAQDWLPGQAVKGLYSFGYKNLVFDQAITFTNWLQEEYPDVRLFSEVDREMVAEYLGEKVATCTPDTIRTLLATLKKLQEGLRAMNWIHEEIMPQEWTVDGRNPPRGPYAPDESVAIKDWIRQRDAEYGQALDFILSSGARIDEVLHLRTDKVSLAEKKVELLGKGGKTRNIRVLDPKVLTELDLSRPFVYLPEQQACQWKGRLEQYVRQACDQLDIRRRGVHGFRATAACKFVDLKRALGYTEAEARRELTMWLGHNPHRTEVTYAYVPRARSTIND
jgi:integrase